MTNIFLILVFFLGLIIGSFLNALSFRYGTSLSSGKGRSMCMKCGHKLVWYDLIPLLSFLILTGKCRYCKLKIGVQYPLVELITGLIFALSLYVSGLPTALYWWFVWSILIVIFIYDLRHKIIPDGLVYLLIITSSVSLFFSFHLQFTFMNLIAGPIFFLIFASLWFFSGGTWMGLGDAKLFLGVGLMLGFSEGLSAIVLSFWIGAFVSLFIILTYKIFQLNEKNKPLTMKSEVPFGPFIIIGALAIYLFGFDILSLNSLF